MVDPAGRSGHALWMMSEPCTGGRAPGDLRLCPLTRLRDGGAFQRVVTAIGLLMVWPHGRCHSAFMCMTSLSTGQELAAYC